jgi:hypothetical protein
VAATSRTGARSYYSNFGALVKIAAPGGETNANANDGILSTLNVGTTTPGEDSYAFYQGTSMATPHVAAVAALLKERRPSITPDEVLVALQKTAQPFSSSASRPCTVQTCGAGIIDAAAAVDFVSGGEAGAIAASDAADSSAAAIGSISLVGEWMIGDSGEVLRIGKNGSWFHPLHGLAKIRKAEDAADIKVFYEHGAAECSYRVSFSEGGKLLDLAAANPSQNADYCPEGSFKKIGGESADISRR